MVAGTVGRAENHTVGSPIMTADGYLEIVSGRSNFHHNGGIERNHDVVTRVDGIMHSPQVCALLRRSAPARNDGTT